MANSTTEDNTAPVRCTCVIQARVGSSRLPGKVLMPLAGKPVLQHVIERAQKIPSVTDVVCAVPDSEEDRPLQELATQLGAKTVAGSEKDVLSRFIMALDLCPADYVMRITADCPLLDPQVCDQLVQEVVGQGFDYGVTTHFPHGLDCEVIRADLLREAASKSDHPLDREHVTIWAKRNPEVTQFHMRPTADIRTHHRWVVDYPEDFQFLEALTTTHPEVGEALGWERVVDLIETTPHLKNINRERIAEWRNATAKIHQEAMAAPLVSAGASPKQ